MTEAKRISTDDFTVVRVVGEGRYGLVMEVKKNDSQKTFALKEMSKTAIEQEDLVQHIFDEKAILQRIDHPFIVKLHYAFQTEAFLYLVLDLLAGGEMFFHLSKAGNFDEWRAKFYSAEIGLALGHLHSLDIIYRDLKPENAVLDRDGHVCLTDFGLAKTNIKSSKDAHTYCGTPEYLAPEHLMGEGHGKAVDWWGLGVLLYEMLCGIPPFYSENLHELYDHILTMPLEFPDDVPISAEAKDLVSKLLVRDPDARLQDVNEFKAHPFFKDMDFDALYARKIKPPFTPSTDIAENFDPEFTGRVVRLGASTTVRAGNQVAGFTYEGQRPTK